MAEGGRSSVAFSAHTGPAGWEHGLWALAGAGAQGRGLGEWNWKNIRATTQVQLGTQMSSGFVFRDASARRARSLQYICGGGFARGSAAWPMHLEGGTRANARTMLRLVRPLAYWRFGCHDLGPAHRCVASPMWSISAITKHTVSAVFALPFGMWPRFVRPLCALYKVAKVPPARCVWHSLALICLAISMSPTFAWATMCGHVRAVWRQMSSTCVAPWRCPCAGTCLPHLARQLICMQFAPVLRRSGGA